MKKIKLFLAAVAAMVGLSASAQSWTAPTIQGDDPVAGQQYKVMNVGSGLFLDMGKAWFGWSTTAIVNSNGIDFTMTADGDNWKFIRTGTQGVFTSGNGIAGDAMHVDNTAHTYGITKLPNGYYHIHDTGGDASSTCWGYNNSFNATGVVAHADANADGWNCEWVFIQPSNVASVAALYSARLGLYNEYLKAVAEGVDIGTAANVYNNSVTVNEINAATAALHQARIDYKASFASDSNPIDLTDLFVVNADFSTLDGTGWTRTQSSVGNQQFSTGAMESWNNNNVSVLQNLSGLPNGKFRVSCDMISGNDTKTAYVYAKGMTEVNGEKVSAKSSAGNYTTMSNEVAGNTVSAYPVIVDNHTMTIGFKDPSGWVVVDNFKLLYYGPDLSALKEALQVNINAVAALEGTTTTAAYNAAKNYADGIDMDALTTEDGISAVSTELTRLVDVAKSLQTSYANFNQIKAAVLAVNKDIDLSAVIASVEASTTVDVFETAIADARSALKSYLGTVENEKIDLTVALLINPSFEMGLDGWTNSGQLQAQAQGNKAFDNYQGNFYAEKWHADGTVNLNQTLADMPAGYYQLSAYVFSEPADGQLYANSTSTSVSTSQLYTLIFQLEEAGNITFGASCTLTSSTWFCMDDFKLSFLGTAPLFIFQNQLADVADQAKTHAASLNSTIPAAALTAYNNAINAAEADNATIAACRAGIAAIEAATAAADALVAPYADYYLYANEVEKAGNLLSSALSEQNSAVEQATTVDGVNSAKAALIAAVDAVAFSATLFITNPEPYSNVDGWTVSVSPNSFDPTNQCAEFWNLSAATMKQVVTLPRGIYRLNVVALTRTGYTSTFEAAGQTKQLVQVSNGVVNTRAQANTWFNEGNGVNTLIFKVEEDNTDVTIGINVDEANGDHWTVFRSFALDYLSSEEPLFIYQASLASKVQAANEYATTIEGRVPSAALQVFNKTVSDVAQNNSTVAECESSIKAIEDATAGIEAFLVPFAANSKVLEKAIATAALGQLGSAAAVNLQSVIDGNTAALNACTTVEEIEAQDAALWEAIGVAINTIELTSDEELDLTYLLTNPDLTDCPSWNGAEGWYTDQTGGNSQVMNNEAATSEDGTKTKFYEWWTSSALQNDKFALYQKIILPEGTYSINCYAFAQDQYAGTNTAGVYFYANDTQGSVVTATRLTEASIDFVNDAAQEVKIGLKTVNPNSYNWMGIGYVTLKKIAPKTIDINEAVAYTPATAAGTVNLVRTLNANKWNTFVVPFAITNDELKATFGDEVAVAEFSEEVVDAEQGNVMINFTMMEIPSIAPNKPILLMPTQVAPASATAPIYTFENRSVAASEPVVAGQFYAFQGTYTPQTVVAENDYFISGNKLFKSKGNTTINGTRAYLKEIQRAGEVKFTINGIATSISEINGGENGSEGAIYTIAGQRVNKAQKGLYIVNGKKVVVK